MVIAKIPFINSPSGPILNSFSIFHIIFEIPFISHLIRLDQHSFSWKLIFLKIPSINIHLSIYKSPKTIQTVLFKLPFIITPIFQNQSPMAFSLSLLIKRPRKYLIVINIPINILLSLYFTLNGLQVLSLVSELLYFLLNFFSNEIIEIFIFENFGFWLIWRYLLMSSLSYRLFWLIMTEFVSLKIFFLFDIYFFLYLIFNTITHIFKLNFFKN